MNIIKTLTKAFLARIGYQISSIKKKPQGNQEGYFNNGKSSLAQNSRQNYDKFYSDTEGLRSYFDRGRFDFYKNVVAIVLEKNVDLNNKNIADFGCGSGHLLKHIDDIFSPKNSSGNDFSGKGIAFAAANFPAYHFYVHDIYAVDPHKYDFIFCSEVLEHLEYPERAIRNILQSVEKNGGLLLTVPNGRADTSEEHINFWSPESWNAFVENHCGGRAWKTGLFNKDQYMFALIADQFSALPSKI